MFGKLTDIAEALNGVVAGLTDLVGEVAARRDDAPPDEGLRERLETLELSRATWEAEIDGLLLRAENHLKSARAAEERARTKKKASSADAESDEPGDEPLEEYLEKVRLQIGDGVGIPPSEVPQVREDVAPYDAKSYAKNSKWGIA